MKKSNDPGCGRGGAAGAYVTLTDNNTTLGLFQAALGCGKYEALTHPKIMFNSLTSSICISLQVSVPLTVANPDIESAQSHNYDILLSHSSN